MSGFTGGLPEFFGNSGAGISALDELAALHLEANKSLMHDDADLDLTNMGFDDQLSQQDGEGYYKAQLPEFFNSIHDPHGEYLSILNEYKQSAGIDTSRLSMDRQANAPVHLPPGCQVHSAPPGLNMSPSAPPPPGFNQTQPPGLSSNPTSSLGSSGLGLGSGLVSPSQSFSGLLSATPPPPPLPHTFPPPPQGLAMLQPPLPPGPPPQSSLDLLHSSVNIATLNSNSNSNISISINSSGSNSGSSGDVHAAGAYRGQTIAASLNGSETSSRPEGVEFFQEKRKFNYTKYMSSSDIRFVVNKVLQPVETNDPYAEDFYNIQFNIKKNQKLRDDAMRESKPVPPMIHIPLPTWKETKERIKLQIEVTRQAFHKKAKDWEEKEMVLGHCVRSNITKPKELLSVPTLSELDFDENDENEYKTPFSTRLWSIRLSVQQGFQALYTVQELHHLLASPIIAASPASMVEIQKEVENAMVLLSQSVGIRTNPVRVADFSLDGGHVGAMLQTPKGKKLIGQSLKHLLPEHRWALVPIVLTKLLQVVPAAGAVSENHAVEQKLLQTIVEFFQFSYQYQIDQQKTMPANNTAPFTNILLINLRVCIKSVLVTQMEKKQLRQALVSDRSRAQIMHMIVQIGDRVAAVADRQLAEEWAHTREAFMSMLDG
jgi:hypothetical protein